MIRRHNLASVLAALALSVAAATAMATGDAQVRPFVRGSWQQIKTTHASQPVVIHFWGVTCAPCGVEMPIWGQLVKERADLKLVTIHADRIPPDTRAVPRMLSDAGLASTEGWTFAERFQEPLRFEVDPEWRGEIPMTLLIGRDGLVKTIIGSAEPHDIRAWLDEQKKVATR